MSKMDLTLLLSMQTDSPEFHLWSSGCDMLRSFLPSVVRFSEADGAVVYVADNGSTDASVAMLRREFPSVHLILLEENHGFADGYNLALKQVRRCLSPAVLARLR